MESHKICYCEDKYEEHLCALKKREQTDQIQQLVDRITLDPTVSCLLCGALAKSDNYLCTSVRLDD